MNLRMDLSILVNGKMDKDSGEGNKYGKMEVFMRANGKIIWQME